MKELDENNYKTELNNNISLLLLHSEFCPPCIEMKDNFEELEKKIKNNSLSLFIINVLEFPTYEEVFSTNSTPTLILYKHGKEINKIVGLQTVQDIQKFILSSLSK